MTRHPNIVLVSVDSLRADHCGFLGDERGLTPTMDALADGGVVFENAIAPGPQTFSSMPVTFTGHYRPPDTLEGYTGADHWNRRLAAVSRHLDRYRTLPERLQAAGYTTVGVSPNPWASAATGFDRGFDRFVDLSAVESDGPLHRLVDRIPGVDTSRKSVELALNMLTGRSFFVHWRDVFGELQRLCEALVEPYFLWLFVLDTHFPFFTRRHDRVEQSLPGMYHSALRSEGVMRGDADALTAGARESLQRSYRDAVRAVDSFLDALVADLDDDPVVVVHADHGESFGAHGVYGHHHRRVYEENVHVPYLVANADVRGRVAAPASLATLPDTVATVAETGTFDPERATAPAVVATSECGTYRTVRARRFKYLESASESRLVDLRRDPGEQTDCSGDWPDRTREFRRHLARFDSHLAEVDRLHDAAATVAARGEC